ncbi:MAG: SDR family NAD(P)-dependent oxidoreductase [Acidobacteriota bacterium]|nr:SDR family NAD(P)-dependent oxidoreductase [Acidobacteriota bacterium]
MLVTGAAGFIGSHLVDALLERGAIVRTLDNYSTGARENLKHHKERIEAIEGDIRDLATCQRSCRDTDVVFHEAALGSVPRSLADPATTINVNVSGTANVFAAAREARVARVVYASSSSVYGDSDRLPMREGEEGRPLSPYALSKVMNEELAATFSRCFGMELIGLRYFNVYGPRQSPDGPYAAVIPRFFAASFARQAPVIYGDGAQSRDFTYVADAVAANLLAATAPATAFGASYNVAGGSRTSVLELARLVCEAAGGGPEPRFEAPRAGDVLHSLADVSRSRERLGFEAGWPLSRGLERSRAHYAAALSTAVERER